MDGFLDGLMTGLAWLLRSSWQGALLVLVILAVQGVFRGRLSPQWRHALWGLLIVRLLLVWAPASPWSVYNMAVPKVPVVFREIPSAVSSSEVPPVVEAAAVAPPVSMAVREGAAPPAGRDVRDLSDGRDLGTTLGVREVAALIWLGITLLFLGVMGYQTLRFGRHVRTGRLVTDSATLDLLEECRTRLRVSTFLALVETDCVRSPALLGCVRPKLLLPRGFLGELSREEMRHIFLHELAHVKRGDIWSSWLINLLTAAHWFNPLIWFARRRFIADREAACDAHVLAALDESGQRAYGHTVLNLMQRFDATGWAPGIAGISETNSNLKRRILMIKHFRAPTRLAAWVGAGLCVCIGLATLTNAQETAVNVDKIRAEASKLAEEGQFRAAIELLDSGRAAQAEARDEFSALILKYKLNGDIPLTAAEKGYLVRQIEEVLGREHGKSVASLEAERLRAGGLTGEAEGIGKETKIDELKTLLEDIKRQSELVGMARSSGGPILLNEGLSGVRKKMEEDLQVRGFQEELAKVEVEIAGQLATKAPSHPLVVNLYAKRDNLLNAIEFLSSAICIRELDALRDELLQQYERYKKQLDEVSGSSREGESRPMSGQAGSRLSVAVDGLKGVVSDTEKDLRGDCQNNLKQLGLRFKMFAIDSKTHALPLLSQEPGRLMFEWGGGVATLRGEDILSARYPGDIPAFCACPATGNTAEIPDDTDYAYLAYVMQDDDDVADFAAAYREHVAGVGTSGVHFTDNLPSKRNPDRGVLRLREGVERFFITDINNPAGAALAQSKIPIVIEWPDHHPTETGKSGGNVLYMDGHVEFLTYPGKWPMTEETMRILCDLAGRDPIKAMDN